MNNIEENSSVFIWLWSALIMENIFSVSEPYYFLCKVLGLFPMSFEGPKTKGVFKTKWNDVVCSLLSLIVPVLLIALNFYLEYGPTSSSAMLSDLWKIQAVFGVFLILLQHSYQISKNKEIPRFLNAVNEFDQKVVLCSELDIIEISHDFLVKSSGCFYRF